MSDSDKDLGPETTGAEDFAESGAENIAAESSSAPEKKLDARSEEAVAVLRDLAYAAIGLGATALKDIGDFASRKRGSKDDVTVIDADSPVYGVGTEADWEGVEGKKLPQDVSSRVNRVIGGGKDKLRELSEDLSDELQGAGENFTSFVENARRRFDETLGKFQDSTDATLDRVARLPEDVKGSSEKLTRENLKATADEYLEQAFSLYRQYVERGEETADKVSKDSADASERMQARAGEGIRQATTLTEQALTSIAARLNEAASEMGKTIKGEDVPVVDGEVADPQAQAAAASDDTESGAGAAT